MADRPRKPLFPNPFYVVLLLASTAFAVTALGYLVSPMVAEQGARKGAAGPGDGSRALAAWFDRNGPVALGVEFVIMLLFGLLAMATDHWFPSRPARAGPRPQ